MAEPQRTVSLAHDYAAPASDVWRVATSYAALHEVCAPLIRFSGVPQTGFVAGGDTWNAKVRLFGVLPPQDYRMHVVFCDHDAMTFRSEETGAGADRWDHALSVIPTAEGAQLSETITIEAGRATPAFAAWARFLYGRRHPKRRDILTSGRIGALS